MTDVSAGTLIWITGDVEDDKFTRFRILRHDARLRLAMIGVNHPQRPKLINDKGKRGVMRDSLKDLSQNLSGVTRIEMHGTPPSLSQTK